VVRDADAFVVSSFIPMLAVARRGSPSRGGSRFRRGVGAFEGYQNRALA
jgi:hypothetical protein